MKRLINFLSLACLALCSAAQTERIVFEAPVLYPEGVTYSPLKKLFFVSSVKTGTIGSVDASGTYKELYKDAGLKSSFGMKMDEKNNRLLVCVSDPNYSMFSTPATFKKMARLIGIDISTGAKKMDINLALAGVKHFANDLAMDESGNIYVTDSYSPNVYKIDAAGKASLFATSPWFMSEDVGLNGIVYNPQGYLLVDHNTNGALYKIDVKNPKNITQVKMKTFFPGADGLLFMSPATLVLIQNKGVNKAFEISSRDNWMTAEVKSATTADDRFQHPTTGTVLDSKVWLLNSKMNELADSSIVPSRKFSLQAAMFRPVN